MDQRSLTAALRAALPGVEVKSEWSAELSERRAYSPRIDIAVGPFAVERELGGTYDRLILDHHHILRRLHDSFRQNVLGFTWGDPVPDLRTCVGHNQNARCLMAIELERTGSQKHLMGGAMNACGLGRVGLSVACVPDKLPILLRMRSYLLFLAYARKSAFNPTNLVIVTVEQLADAIGCQVTA